MRRKRNSINLSFSTSGYIKKYFGDSIRRILVPNDRSIQNCEMPYVPHPEAEEALQECLVNGIDIDKSLVFTGLTGSGKTTILRHVFKLEQNANKTYIDGKTIVIPIDFNRAHHSAEEAIHSNLRVAVRKICGEYGITFPDVENQKFYEYIKEIREDFFEMDAKCGRNTPFEKRMNIFLDKLPTAFASCQLQYAMDDPKCELDLATLVVDNIEAYKGSGVSDPRVKYLAPVIEAFKLADCIGQRSQPTKWCFNMVIACRHHIWRIMKGEFSDSTPENILLQSYVATEVPFDLANPVSINEIVKKREDVFSRRQRDPERWNTAVTVVNTILQTMENNVGDFILQIELKDLRKSMAKMQELILHKGLQKESNESIDRGAFRIESTEQFDLSRVNIIKVFGLGPNKYYSDKDSPIPNLLYNDFTNGMELYVLLTLNYFFTLCGYSEPTWDNPVSVFQFYEAMKYIFGDDYSSLGSLFQRSIRFLLQHRLLLRSADQPQDEVPGLSVEEVNKIEYVYVSGSALALWRELGRSSALFQLFIDDIWLDEDSEYFAEDGNSIERCVQYLGTLFRDAEKRIYNSARNLSDRSGKYYLECFGKAPICKQLVNGLIASLEAIVASGDRSQERIRTAGQTLKQAKALSEEICLWEEERQR